MTSDGHLFNQFFPKWSTSNKLILCVSWYNAMRCIKTTYTEFLPNSLTWILSWGNNQINPSDETLLKTTGDLNSLINVMKDRKKGQKKKLLWKSNVIYNTCLNAASRIRKINRLKDFLGVTGEINIDSIVSILNFLGMTMVLWLYRIMYWLLGEKG